MSEVQTGSLLVALLLASGAVAASTIEDTLDEPCDNLPGPDVEQEFCHYQYDGGEHGDASDVCSAADRELGLGGEVEGVLIPVDDTRDHYNLRLSNFESFNITLEASEVPLGNTDLRIQVFEDDCVTEIASGSASTGAPAVLPLGLPAGDYVVRVELPPTEPGAGISMPDTPLDAHVGVPFGCHPTCVGTVNDVLGYRLKAEG